MASLNEKAKDMKLLQVYVEPELHSVLRQYCLDHETKNVPLVRELLTRFLEGQKYYDKRGNE